jgi:2-polyprenyl-3-methyl-5-hydroxy-6-metoxy-1,4-benzoquinol methylase
MIHHKVCPLCSDPEISHFLSCTDQFVSQERFDIFKCKKCGFTFTRDYPEESEAGKYYESDDYISHSNSNKRVTDKAYQFIRKIMLSRKKRIIRKITGLPRGNILDIGSGTGHFLNTMRRSGWNISGVEINAKARESCSKQFSIDTIPTEKMDTLPENSFDCITLWHVLEHFHEPFKLMEVIGQILKPSGVVVIALPNSSSFDSMYFGNKWAAYDVPRHLWHFNPTTFSLFAAKNKLSIAGTGHLPFDVFYISILSERYIGSYFPLLTGTIKGLMFAICSLFRKKGSSSVIYYLRKAEY